MNAKFYEFQNLKHAQLRHSDLTRLGWRPFSIFQTARGTWGFWVP